jgi:hypothetical protein
MIAKTPSKIAKRQFRKHLTESALQVLLDLMNDIWETGDLPSIWKLANVIPIPKPGKDLVFSFCFLNF